MRPLPITVLGAGPAGLYLSLLLKKAQPGHEVTVLERNPADATYGWGVVFSEETLGSLRDADQATYLEITDTFARWDAIDIRYRDRTLRSRGHSFSAIARRTLLGILQRRCREVGVRLEFGVEITDPSTLEGELVVAADGVNSVVRRSRDDVFGGRITPQGCKYVWYGTDLVFDAFTFLFKETEHGLFQVHGYPFDENTSTFIVECPHQTWESAGLDTMDEAASMAFCASLFAEELGGHRLRSNRSLWLDFPRLVTKHWHDGNVVLLGDSAHTAHFTIGSGTKLAMEDAIALAAALDRHTDLTPALVDYELERKPVIERFQQAAASSADYFERVGRHTGLDPLPFAVNLLTRSGRIGHAALSVRDASFVRAVDSWHGTRGASTSAICPPPAFTPFALGELVLHNRIVQDTPGGGLVLAGTEPVTEDGRRTPSDGLKWTELRDSADGGAVGLRIGHAGRRGATREPTHGVDVPLPADQTWPLVAASAIPYGPRSAVPRELDEDGMDRIRDAFVAMARRAIEFDLLELDMAHGFLLGGFLSPLTNRRADGYGGDLDGRLRYPLEVLAAVREAWPKPLSVRLSVTDWTARGTTPDDGVAIARAVAEAGADLIHVAAGQTVPESAPDYRRGFLTPLADRVRSEAGVPTMVGGYLTTVDEVNTVIAAARADLCVLAPPDRPGVSALPPGCVRRSATPCPADTPGRNARHTGAERPTHGGGTPDTPWLGVEVTRFDELTSTGVAAVCERAVVLVPLGAVEAHGPHGPLGTDSIISEGMCRRAADALAGELPVLVLPTLPYGVTDYAGAFPGTVGVSASTLHALLTDVCESLRRQGFRRIVVVNNHFEPEHLATVRAVAAELGVGHLDLVRRRNAHRIGGEFATGSCHAGRYETSLVLVDAPELVGDRAGLPAITVDLPAQMSLGHKDFQSMGMADAYCGAPADATVEEGAATFAVLTELLVEAIREEATP